MSKHFPRLDDCRRLTERQQLNCRLWWLYGGVAPRREAMADDIAKWKGLGR